MKKMVLEKFITPYVADYVEPNSFEITEFDSDACVCKAKAILVGDSDEIEVSAKYKKQNEGESYFIKITSVKSNKKWADKLLNVFAKGQCVEIPCLAWKCI